MAEERRRFRETGPGRYEARLHGLLDARADEDGLRVQRGGDALGLRTEAVGGRAARAGVPSLGACAPTPPGLAEPCRRVVHLDQGPAVEWWTSRREGVRHGWTLPRPVAEAPVRLEVVLSPGELVSIDADGRGALLRGSAGEPWRYEGLLAWDASGRTLPATLSGAGGTLTVTVDTVGARYPVVVDPLVVPAVIQEHKLTASDGVAYDTLGWSLSPAGDVDGDGHDDVVVGTYGASHTASTAGAAYVYYGASSGIDAAAEDKLIASDAASYDYYAYSLGGGGDLDGDGYDDVVVGAIFDDDGGSSSGSAYVYFGTATGIDGSSEQKLTASDAAASDQYGYRVALVGDIDADGYDDLAITANGDDDNGSASGSAYVYLGSATGVDAGSEQKVAPSDGGSADNFGVALGPAGDVDGDGHADVIGGMPYDDDVASDAGAAYVYYGSATGIDASREQKLTASDGAAHDAFAWSVATAGDLDGDGLGDLVVGAYSDDDGGAGSGAAYVYLGTATGVDTSSEVKLTASDAAAGDYFGWSVASAGDLDGDGHSEVVVGAFYSDQGGTTSGSAYVYFGHASGIDTDSEVLVEASDTTEYLYFGVTVASAGDLDADGRDDLVIGAYGDDTVAEAAGAAYVFSLDKLVPPDGAEGDGFGLSVADAGDVDGDGHDDVVVGAHGVDIDGTDEGSAYVYYGAPGGIRAAEATTLVASDAADEASFGWSVAGAGDVDGDGLDDVIVGAPGTADGGAAYLFLGSSSGADSDSEQQLVLEGAAADAAFGWSVAGVGDVDGDGLDDVLVGAPGAGEDAEGGAFLYLGSASGLDETPQELLASDGAAGDALGWSVAGAGDVDGDGLDDAVLGAPGDDDAGDGAGSAYVYLGHSSGLDAGSEVRLEASDAAAGDALGTSVAGAGDLDADGLTEVILGAPGDDDLGSEAGAAYVYYGSSTGSAAASEQKLTASDGAADEAYGTSVSGAGDVDADGYDDVLVGAPGDTGAGAAYVVFGSSSGADADSEQVLTAWDGEAGDAFGTSVSRAGDVDGDGYDDVIIGAPDKDGDGAVYVLSGDCRDEDDDGSCRQDDCDDADPDRHPGADEVVGDEVDQDCDGLETCYADADDDGYTDGATTVSSSDVDCADAGEGTASDPEGDCDDTDATVHPGAAEQVGDEVDTDCDGGELCTVDGDDDGYLVDAASTVVSADSDCSDTGEGLAGEPTGDCDDTDPAVHPGASEGVGDGRDQDCDGEELCYVDVDGDGYVVGSGTVVSADLDCTDPGEADADAPDGDCDDSDPAFHPGAPGEECTDPNDYDCDGHVDYRDVDGDGWPACVECDDLDEDVHPDAPELCNGVDDDCDGEVDDDPVDASTWYSDADGDGFGDAELAQEGCEQPDGTVANAADCDDTDASVWPGAPEVVGDGLDQDCDGEDAQPPVHEDTGGVPAPSSGDDGGGGCGGCVERLGFARTGSAAVLWLGFVLGARRRRR